MTATVYLPLLGQFNKRQYPVTQDQFNSLLGTYGTVIVSPAVLAATLATYAALSGTNVFTGKEQFRDLPWADIMAYGAKGDNSHDDTAAIQAAINHMSSAYAGGYVFFSPGLYKISTAVTVTTGVILLGSGAHDCGINGQGQDSTAVVFDSTCSYAGAENIAAYGYANSLATTDAVTIAPGVTVNLRGVLAWLGRYGLNTAGVDGRYYGGCFFTGYTNCVYSTGANFYTDCKMDPSGTNPVYAFQPMENQFMACDFGGSAASIHVDDGGTNDAFTKVVSGILAAPIHVVSHRWTSFVSCEFGSATFSLTGTNPVTFVGNNCLAGTATLAGANVILSGNYNIVA